MPSGDIKQELSDVVASLEKAAQAFKRGDFDEAEPAYRQALEVLERVYGAGDPDTIACLQSLGDIYYATGRYKEAMPLYRRLLSIGETVLGKNHPGVVEMVMRLGTAYEQLGMDKDAEAMYRRACQMSNMVLGALKPPQPFQPPPSPEVTKAFAGRDEQSISWRVLDPKKLSGNFLDPAQDIEDIDLSEPAEKPTWKNKKGGKFDKSRGAGDRKSAKVLKDSIAGKFKLYADFFVYGVAGIILITVIGYAIVNFAPKKNGVQGGTRVAAFKGHVYSSADNYIVLTIGGAQGSSYSLGHNPQPIRVECVGPDLLELVRASISSLSDRQLWFEDDGNALKAEDGSLLYLNSKQSPEKRVIEQMLQVARTAQYWYQASGKYPSKPSELADLRYMNPFSNKFAVPELNSVNGSGVDTSEVVDTQVQAPTLAETLMRESSALWREEPKPEPGAIHCLSVISQQSSGESQQMFFVHGFDRNGKLFTGRGGGSVYLLQYADGKSTGTPSGGIKPKATHPRSLAVYIANLSGLPLNMTLAHYLMPFVIASLSIIALIWAMFGKPQGGTMSDASSLTSKLALLGLLVAAVWVVLVVMP